METVCTHHPIQSHALILPLPLPSLQPQSRIRLQSTASVQPHRRRLLKKRAGHVILHKSIDMHVICIFVQNGERREVVVVVKTAKAHFAILRPVCHGQSRRPYNHHSNTIRVLPFVGGQRFRCNFASIKSGCRVLGLIVRWFFFCFVVLCVYCSNRLTPMSTPSQAWKALTDDKDPTNWYDLLSPPTARGSFSLFGAPFSFVG